MYFKKFQELCLDLIKLLLLLSQLIHYYYATNSQILNLGVCIV